MADGSIPVQAVRIVPATVADIACVAIHMRPDEIEQWLALTGVAHYVPDVAVRAVVNTGDPCWAMVDMSGRPFVVGGMHVDRPGVASLWMMGTMAGWALHWRVITKTAKRFIAGLLDGDMHRVEVTALASRTEAHRWYRRLGLNIEEPRRAWFADGSDGVCFAAVGEV